MTEPGHSKSPNDSKLSCLICKDPSLGVSTSLTGTQIRQLWVTLGTTISEAAYGPLGPETVVNLYRCNSCGFRFYDPALAGTGRFYEELMTSKAYPLGGMDFDHVINFATRHGIRRVLDIGCGEGVFLDLARDAGITTTGVELNRNAAETAARKGHRMIHKSIKSIHPDELDGGAELLTLFQVLEHVPAPAEFVASAARLVKSGGHVAIAVPSDRRMLGLLENDPADWPPHHISRWRIEDLRKLGERAGLELVDIGSNPLFGTDIPWACKLHDRLEGALGRKMLRLPKPILECAALIYRSLRLKNISNFHGPSIRAIFRKSQKRPI